jgi:hypothetical protein
MANLPEFKGFSKIPRYNREVIVTEKIDGTNGQIYITEDNEIYAGSRNRWLTVNNSDNYGFAKWVQEHKEDLLTLGHGRHFGEWWGSGIQRKYNLKEKRFSLFNTFNYATERPDCCGVVPIIWRGLMEDLNIERIMSELLEGGSFAAPGFMQPEGIVIFHTASGNLYKKTFNDDNKGAT